MRQIPRREPKFHQAEMFEGEGRSIKELLIIFSRGWDFRILGAIGFGVYWVSRRRVRMDRANVPR